MINPSGSLALGLFASSQHEGDDQGNRKNQEQCSDAINKDANHIIEEGTTDGGLSCRVAPALINPESGRAGYMSRSRKRKGQPNESIPCVIFKLIDRHGRLERKYFAGLSELTNRPVWRRRSAAWEFKSIRECKEALILCQTFYDNPNQIKMSPLWVPVKIVDLPNGDKAALPRHLRDKTKALSGLSKSAAALLLPKKPLLDTYGEAEAE